MKIIGIFAAIDKNGCRETEKQWLTDTLCALFQVISAGFLKFLSTPQSVLRYGPAHPCDMNHGTGSCCPSGMAKGKGQTLTNSETCLWCP